MEHVEQGRLTLEEYAVYTFIIQNANHTTGVWQGCAKALARQTRKSERWCQYVLASLRCKGYISGKPSVGRGQYPIKVTKYFEGKAHGASPSEENKAHRVSPSEQEGAPTFTLSPQKAHPRSPLEEVIQEVKHKNPPLASLAAPAHENSGFDAFWEVFPRKVGKFMARKAWGKIPGIEDHILEVIEAVEAWKQTEQWQDAQFIPYPATFLNQRRWQDEVPVQGGTKNEQRIRRSLEESAALARQIRDGTANLGLGDTPRRAFQSKRPALIA